MALLGGVRVVELADDPAAAFAARLLAALGADAITVEPPQGSPVRAFHRVEPEDPDTSLLWAYLAAGKRSVVLEPASPSGRATLEALLGSADVVIEARTPGQRHGGELTPLRWGASGRRSSSARSRRLAVTGHVVPVWNALARKTGAPRLLDGRFADLAGRLAHIAMVDEALAGWVRFQDPVSLARPSECAPPPC